MSGSSSKQFDVVILGATGYTGSLVAEYMFRTYGSRPQEFSWGICGRSESKLSTLKGKLSGFGENAKDINVVVADVTDESSLHKLVAATNVIVSTVGPFQKYGNQVVKACVEGGISYCDITGEPFWIRENIQRYHKQAEKTGAKIVHCCGYDSIPADIGTLLLADHMNKKHNGTLSEVTAFVMDSKGAVSGGTLSSMVGQMDVLWKMSKEEKKTSASPYLLNPEDKKPNAGDAAWDTSDGGFGFNQDIKKWTAPFVMAAINAKVVRRSNALLNNQYGAPFKYQEIIAMGDGMAGFLGAFSTTALTAAAGALLYPPLTRNVLSRFLLKPGEGPTREQRDQGYFKYLLVGKGKTADSKKQRMLKAEFSSKQGDPGYKETSKMLAESALCLALERPFLPDRSGILTPASGIGMALVSRLRKANMTIEVFDDVQYTL